MVLIKGVVFDLDGTLLDTLRDLAEAGNHVLAERGLPTHPVARYKTFIGDGAPMLVHRMLPEKQRVPHVEATCCEAFREAYRNGWDRYTRAYDGVAEMLDELQGRHLRLAVLTNKPDEFAQQCVARLLAGWTFDPVIGQRADMPRKPDPAGVRHILQQWGLPPECVFYLGDSGVDMQTSVAAGTVSIGVTWGFRPASELQAAGAHSLLGDPRVLPEMLDAYPGGQPS